MNTYKIDKKDLAKTIFSHPERIGSSDWYIAYDCGRSACTWVHNTYANIDYLKLFDSYGLDTAFQFLEWGEKAPNFDKYDPARDIEDYIESLGDDALESFNAANESDYYPRDFEFVWMESNHYIVRVKNEQGAVTSWQIDDVADAARSVRDRYHDNHNLTYTVHDSNGEIVDHG